MAAMLLRYALSCSACSFRLAAILDACRLILSRHLFSSVLYKTRTAVMRKSISARHRIQVLNSLLLLILYFCFNVEINHIAPLMSKYSRNRYNEVSPHLSVALHFLGCRAAIPDLPVTAQISSSKSKNLHSSSVSTQLSASIFSFMRSALDVLTTANVFIL